MSAKTITNKEEVIVCKSIDQALTSYLQNKDNKIKAVIIDKTAPETLFMKQVFSHHKQFQ